MKAELLYPNQKSSVKLLDKYNINGFGETFKTPIEKRLKNSKFANLIKNFDDAQIKALIYVLLFDSDLKTAIDYYSKAVDNRIQLYALQKEYNERFNIQQLK